MTNEEVITRLDVIASDRYPLITDSDIEALKIAMDIVKEKESTTKNDLPHCNHTDEEIAKSFIEDVEAVKDQLPCGEQMDFPSTFDEFAKDYGFKDKDEIYTNGSELIPVFRVKQWLEHISTIKNDLAVREFEGIEVIYPPEEVCIYPEYKGKPYFGIKYKENGEEIVGYGTYNPKVLSQYLKEYFIPTTKNDLGDDCISRKAVFETIDDCNSDGLKGIFCSYDDGERFKKYIKNLPPITSQLSSVLDKNSKKLEKDFGELDCISRQAVLELIANYDLSMGQVVRGIHALPPVTPQESRWISVEERMPEEDTDVLVTLECGLIGIAQKKLAEDDYGEPCYIWQDFEGEEHEVIAWMPLPLPWREIKE